MKDTIDLETPTYTKQELKEIKEIFSIQSPSYYEQEVTEYICNKLDSWKIPYEIDTIGNILITKGTLNKGEYYPCLAAHLDTVHNFEEDYKVISYKDKQTSNTVIRSICMPTYVEPETKIEYKVDKPEFCGGCGDDLGGVWIVLDLIRKLDVCKAALFVGEEVGCKGSGRRDCHR